MIIIKNKGMYLLFIKKGCSIMKLCSLCERIKNIRIKQGKYYYSDLCDNCKRKEAVMILSHSKIFKNRLAIL